MKKLFAFFSSLLLLACSSMEPDFEDLYGDLLPPDFDWQEFAELNPDIKCAQSIGYISSLNIAWRQEKTEEGLSSSAITALIKADSTVFVGTKANPGPGIEIVKKCYQWTDAGLVDAFFKETGSTIQPNSLRHHVLEYNLYGREDEEEFIDSLYISPTVYSETYIKWGKMEGRPYRACKEGEKQTPRSKNLEKVDSSTVFTIPGAAGNIPKETLFNYSAYEFCADTAVPEPYPVYVIREIPQ